MSGISGGTASSVEAQVDAAQPQQQQVDQLLAGQLHLGLMRSAY